MTSAAATILVVDDEIQNRKLLDLLLKPEGYAVLTAANGQEALAQVARQAPDLILLDAMMPGMDGYQVAGAIKANPATSNIPIIMITASVGREARMTGLNAGAEEILMKPVERAELYLRVRNLLRLKTLGDFFKNHAAILEREVQARTADLSRFRSAMDATVDAITLVDRATMRYVEANATACKMFGYSREELFDIGPAQLVSSSEEQLAVQYDALIAGDGPVTSPEVQCRRKDGSTFPAEVQRHAQRAGDGWIIVGVVHDITERKKAEDKIRRLNRVYAVLSGITTLMVRERDRDELFRQACRIAVEQGQYRMAWIGMVDQEQGLVTPIASAGDVRNFLEVAPLATDETRPGAFGLAGRAILGKKPIFSNDVHADSQRLMRPQMLERDINSLAIIPLLGGGQAIGILALYAAERGAFDQQEMRLLLELAEDISFAVATIEKAAKLGRITRVNAILSEINGAIVRIRDRQELFENTCRIAVETGGLVFAWLCVVDEAEQRLRPVASAGPDDGFLELIRGRFSLRDDAPEGHGLGARAVRDRTVLVVNDIQAADLKYKQAHSDRGIKSAAVFPLSIAGRIVGAFGLHASEVGFFDDDETKLLTQVASNIAFALEHIEKEEKVARLTRVYAVLSGINTLIVRVHNRDELFQEACRIAVDQGGFKLAWVGIVDQGATQIKPVAWAGAAAGYLERMPLSLQEADGERFGLAGQAILGEAPLMVADMEQDARVMLRREAGGLGFHSLVMLPLTVSGRVEGVLALYASEIGFFDEDEMKLLVELAGDIAFAIDHLGKQDRLDYLAYYDALTGVANRSLFLERVAQYQRSATGGGHKLAVFLIDLERFKNINDSLGRPAGDALLKQVAEWLTQNVRDANLLARVGADLFAVVLPQVRNDGNVLHLLERSLDAFLGHAFHLNDAVFRITCKIGVSLFPDDGADADTLLRNAEAALKQAKKTGERYLFYKQKMTEKTAGKLTLENQLREALDKDEFVLHYQPKVSLASKALTGVEALIRWDDPRTGLVPPARFIPILEETGLIYEVGRWALRRAIADYLRWRAAGLPVVRIAVNISPLQLRHRGFIAEIKDVIGVDAHAAAGLELEITESLIMQDIKHSIASLRAIREMAVSVAIDDFGTGFSSLSYLARLPVDTLKIDRSFIIDMTTGPQGLALVSTIIGLGHALKLKVVAEGVETEEQSNLLRLLRCDEMQGYLFSKPLSAEAFETRFLVPPALATVAVVRPTDKTHAARSG